MNNIKYLLLIPALGVAFMSGISIAASTTTATCENKSGQLDVQNAINAMANDDIVTIKAGTCTWTTSLVFTKALTIRGEGDCTLDSDGIPIACPTVIRDGIASNPLMTWTHVAGKHHDMSHIEWNNDTRVGSNGNPLLSFVSTNQPGTTFRFHHNRVFHNTVTRLITFTSAIGVADHNYLHSSINHILWMRSPSWYGPAGEAPPNPDAGDASWYWPVVWGSGDNFFVEKNKIVNVDRACTDTGAGARFVFRFNDVTGCTGASHGTDSGGRSREARSSEWYNNTFDQTGFTRYWLFETRDGSSLVWNNTSQGITSVSKNASEMKNYRSGASYRPFGGVTGRNPMDQNDPANPYDLDPACPGRVCTVTSTGTMTVYVAGANWATNSLRPYILNKTVCPDTINTKSCHSLITSNTASTITYVGNAGAGGTFSIATGDTFEFNKVIAAMDQNGMTGGALLQYKTCTSITGDGVFVTASCVGINASTGGYVAVVANAPHADYGGVWIASQTPNTNSFKFLYSASSGSTTGGTATKIPSTWNDQTATLPSMAWSNMNTNLTDCVAPCQLYAQKFLGSDNIRENTHFFNHVSSLPFTGAINLGVTSAIGVGVLADRPTTCTPDARYWATDQGTWNTSGEGGQGVMYKCTATNTWTLEYTPYLYPHPLWADELPDAVGTRGKFRGRRRFR